MITYHQNVASKTMKNAIASIEEQDNQSDDMNDNIILSPEDALLELQHQSRSQREFSEWLTAMKAKPSQQLAWMDELEGNP